MANTTNYNMTKPTVGSAGWGADVNTNFDTIDTQMKANADNSANKVPTTRTVNSKALSSDITLSASDVSAVPTTRTINSKALSSDVVLTTADVADSADKRYCTDAQKTVIGNTSGTNTGDQTSITITASPSSDITASGMKITLTAGSTVAFGDACYIASTGKATLAKGDAIATSSAVVMALESISADASGSFLLLGVARKDAWNWTVGGLIYLSATGTTTNTLTQTAPTATDSVTQILGVATHQDRLYFCPSLVQIEHT
jgi:hypothetical protein